MRSMFGWSYPPGAANDPNAPYNQGDEPCEVCGNFPDDCICPECPECGDYGNPACYDTTSSHYHGLTRTQEQIDSLAQKEKEWEERNRPDVHEAIKSILDY